MIVKELISALEADPKDQIIGRRFCMLLGAIGPEAQISLSLLREIAKQEQPYGKSPSAAYWAAEAIKRIEKTKEGF